MSTLAPAPRRLPGGAPLDPALTPIAAKLAAGERLDAHDGVTLYRTRDIFTLGALANAERERRHGRRTYFNINRHINYSNFCVLRCKFCAFYRPLPARGEPPADGYQFSLDQIVEQAAEAAARGATEVHIVGGLHPTLPFSFYTDMCARIRAACPTLCIKAFTAIEIVHFTRIARPRMSIREVLAALRDAGLDSLPGGGAEIFDDRVHDEAYRNKVGEAHWFDVHRTAHELGIPTNATMLYGHIESIEERVTHMIKLREAQDEALGTRRLDGAAKRERASMSGQAPGTPVESDAIAPAIDRAGQSEPIAPAIDRAGRSETIAQAIDASPARPAAFQCFIPLSFIPDGSALSHLPGPTGLDDLRTLAVSRLMLDNFDHVKAFWIMQSKKLSQVALDWGVDDFDGTVVWYDITKREGDGGTHQEMGVAEMRRLLHEAGCEPVERDTLYRLVERDAQGQIVRRVRE